MEGSDFLLAGVLFLFAAVAAVPLASRLGIGAVLGYLLAGIAIGPWGLGFISDVDEILHFSELGVVFHVAKVSDLIPELQGRFPVHVQLKSLTREDFQRILTQPDNALTLQYKALLAVDKVMLTFEDSAIEAIADAAFTANETAEDIGARRLHAVFEQVLEDISFNAGDENMPPFELTINGEYVQQHLSGENKPTDLRKYIL